MALIRIDHVKSEALAERILFQSELCELLVDGDLAILDGCLIADLHISNFDVFLGQRTDDLLLTLLCSRSCSCRDGRCRAGGSSEYRNIKFDSFNLLCLADLNMDHTVTPCRCGDLRCCRNRCRCSRCLCFFRFFISCRSADLIDVIKYCRCDRCKCFHIGGKRRAEYLLDRESVITQLQKSGVDHIVEDGRIFKVSFTDLQALLSSAAEDGGVFHVFCNLLFC